LEAVEINAGPWYLRALHLDAWSSDTRYTWAICKATTGESLGEVTLNPATGAVGTRARDGHTAAAVAATDAVRRFASAIVPGSRVNGSQTVVGPTRPE
jgi:hypothetical protein